MREKRSQDKMSHGHLPTRLLTRFTILYTSCCGVKSLDCFKFFAVFEAKLEWPITNIQTHSKCGVVRRPMWVQIASSKDQMPKETWTLALR